MRTSRPTVWIVLVAAMLSMAAMLACAGQALAHAALVRAEPADGAVLPRTPTYVRLTFNEPVSPLRLRLVTPGGSVVALPRVAIDGSALAVGLPETLDGRALEGSYVLSWRVASEDGHPVGGTVLFSVGAPSARPVVDNSNPSVRAAVWLTRFILFVGLFVGVGGAAFSGLVAPLRRSSGRVVQLAIRGGLLAALASAYLQGLDAADVPLSTILSVATWTVGVRTSYLTTACLAAAAMVLALLSLHIRVPRYRTVLSVLALVGVGVALASSGHASMAAPRWLTVPSVFLHTVGVAFWVGSLVPLGFMLWEDGDPAKLARFSHRIRYAVAAILVSSLALGAVQLGWPSAAWISPYGVVLLAKLVLLFGLFGLAAYNRYVLTPHVGRQFDDHPRLRLCRNIRIEVAVAMAILAVVALWRFTPPPRALAEAAAAPAYVHIHTASAMADLTVTPGRAGPAVAEIVLQSGEFGPLAAKEVTLELANPALGIEPIQRTARPAGNGAGEGPWQVEGLTIPAAGRWQVRIEVLVTDFDKLTLDGTLDIAR